MIIGGFPQGLLDLLDSQNFGHNPNNLSEVVSPIVDLTDLYLTSRQAAQITSGGVLANNSSNLVAAGMQVPAGETWLVRAAGAILTAGAGVSATATLVISINGLAVPISDNVLLAASTNRWIKADITRFWLPSGAYLGIYTTDVVGAPTGTISTLVNRLGI